MTGDTGIDLASRYCTYRNNDQTYVAQDLLEIMQLQTDFLCILPEAPWCGASQNIDFRAN